MAGDEQRHQRLARALKDQRLRAGLSERAMALAMKRTSTFVRSYESGKVSLTIDELESAAAVLGMSIADLVAEYQRDT